MITRNPENEIQIRPYAPVDQAGVRDLLVAAYGDKVDPEDVYNWWASGYLPDLSGYLVAESCGQIVGAQPMELFPYSDGASQLLGGLLTGVAVHPDFRRRGIFTALVNECEATAWRHGASFVTTMPNDRSRPGFLKMGYVDLGRRRFLVRPLRPMEMGGKIIPLLGHLAGMGAGVFHNLISKRGVDSDINIDEVGDVSQTWERVFALPKKSNSGLCLTRSYGWLKWRYVNMPNRKYRFFEANSPRHGCCGCLILTQEQRSSLSLGYVMELAAENENIAAALLNLVSETLKKEGLHAVASVVSSSADIARLKKGNFLEVPSWLPMKRFYTVVRFNPEISVPSNWTKIGGWQQTLGDWDSL